MRLNPSRLGIILGAILCVLLALCPAFAQDQTPERKLYTVSTAHLDTQWRWTIRDTIYQFIPNTLYQNFAHFENSPDYVFTFEGAFRYSLMKEYYPAEYERLKRYIAQGRWTVTGASWDAGDVCVPSAEAIMRQALYGNEYFRREFGKTSYDIYLPDCFGFPYSLPSIAAHCGLKGFSSQKLSWGGGVETPFNIGRWEGPDGSSIVASLDPGGYGNSLRGDLSRDEWRLGRINDLGRQSGAYVDNMYYGVGDTGGATDAESVRWLDRSVHGDGPIKVIPASGDQFAREMTPEQIARLPHYKGDLLMAVHGTGCYTSQSAMKRWNRKNELLADSAERAAVAADLLGGAAYPNDKLSTAWKRFLWHQFHDDLTGTSIPEAYEFSWNDEALAQNEFAQVLADSAGAVTRALDTRARGTSLVVYNPLGVARTDVVEATVTYPGSAPEAVRVIGPDGEETPAQVLSHDAKSLRIAFLATVPSVSFSTFDVRPGTPEPSAELAVAADRLRNARYSVRLDANGDVCSIRDRSQNRELLAAPLQLVLLRDSSPSWPAWEVQYRDVSRAPSEVAGPPTSVRIVENGPARVALELVRPVGNSTVIQRISLAAGAAGDRVEFLTQIGWRTKGRMLKLSAPFASANSFATYDMGLGAAQRGNNVPRRYEVPGHQWADLTAADGSTGAAILSDCRYGYDKPDDSTLRLTLVRTPATGGGWNDQASADLGRHELTYAIRGHAGSWSQGGVPNTAARLNQPLIAFQAPAHNGSLGRSYSLVSVSDPRIAVRALKAAQDGMGYILRLQETSGEPVPGVTVSFARPVTWAADVTGAEEPLATVPLANGRIALDMKGFGPRTLRVQLAPPAERLQPAKSAPLALPFNADVVSGDGERGGGDFDGSGRSLPAELLPAEMTLEGVRFRLGSSAPGSLNALACQGQRLAIPPGGARSLYLLACANADTTAAFALAAPRQASRTVSLPVQAYSGFIGQWDSRLVKGRQVSSYADLTPAYLKPAAVAWVGTHTHTPEGANDAYRFVYLFKLRLELPRGATAITLPDDPAIKILAASVGTNPNDDTVPAGILTDQPVPNADLPLTSGAETSPMVPAQNPAGLAPGLAWSYYEGDFGSATEPSGTPVRTGVASTISRDPRGRNEHYALIFEGYIEVPTDGVYTFYTVSDDGSVLQIAGQDVVDNDGLHGASESSGGINLQAGKHPIKLRYFQGPTDSALEVGWEGPGIGRQALPAGVLFHAAP